MKALLIGGTGTISMAITELAAKSGAELTLLNRGHSSLLPQGVKAIHADINHEEEVLSLLQGMYFDVVVEFVGYFPEQVERDIRLFSGKTNQYIFISSASAYQKPMSNYLITESTPLANPYWKYSRDKIMCENVLMESYRKTGFPVTIVRPSHTYGDQSVPLAVKGEKGSWQVIDRIRQGKPVIVHGDGLSLWTFTHNTDFAKAFVGLMDNPHAIGEAVHITSDEAITWNAAYQAIGRALGLQPNLVHISSQFLAKCDPKFEGELLGDKANCAVFDNSKIKRLVPGFTAAVRYDQGVKRTLEYVMSHEECRIPDPEFDIWSDHMIEAFEDLKI